MLLNNKIIKVFVVAGLVSTLAMTNAIASNDEPPAHGFKYNVIIIPNGNLAAENYGVQVECHALIRQGYDHGFPNNTTTQNFWVTPMCDQILIGVNYQPITSSSSGPNSFIYCENDHWIKGSTFHPTTITLTSQFNQATQQYEPQCSVEKATE